MMWVLALFLVSTAWAQFDPTCVDKLENCDQFPASSCKGDYVQWAKVNCNNTCKYCVGPTKPPPPCADTITDCALYSKSTCTDPTFKQWAEHKCRYFCRLCTPLQLQMKDAQTTTIPPQLCKDKLDNCRLYGKTSCTGAYLGWATKNCMAYCGICTGVPTPPHACKDKLPNCSQYDAEACTSKDYALWAEDNCAKHCNLCPGSGGPATPPHVISPVTSGSGPLTPPVPHTILTPAPPGK